MELLEKGFESCPLIRSQNLSDLFVGIVAYGLELRSILLIERFVLRLELLIKGVDLLAGLAKDGFQRFFLLRIQIQLAGHPLNNIP